MLRSRSIKSLVCLVLVLLLAVGTGTILAPGADTSPRWKEKHSQESAASEAASAEIQRVDETWTMRDGIRLPVSVFYPAGYGAEAAAAAFPAIIFIHPWDCEKTFFEGAAAEYAARGYVCITFTVRGWGGAEGSIGCMDPEYEVRDISDVITLVSEDGRFPVLRDERGPVVGIMGYSMGACLSYLISPREDPRPGDPGDPRVRAVVPMHGGTDLVFSILPNGGAKAFWGVFLVAGSFIGNIAGLFLGSLNTIMRQDLNPWQKLTTLLSQFGNFGPLFSNVTPTLGWIVGAALERRVEDVEEGRQYLRERSMRYWCDEEYDGVVEHPVTAPMLMVAGWNDDIFYANEALRAFSTCMEAPARLIVTNHGHMGGIGSNFSIPLPGNAEYDWVNDQVEMWFDHYLKGEDNGADKAPRISFYRGPGDYGEADAYPLPGTSSTPLYLDSSVTGGALSSSPPGGGASPSDLLINIGITGSISLPYYQDVTEMFGGEAMTIPSRLKMLNIPLTERAYISEPLQEDLAIMGTPMLEVYYQSSANFTQLIPWIYEVAPDGTETLVSRGFYEGYDPRTWTTLNTLDKPVEMQACYHRFPKGSRIKLEISTADLLTTLPVFGLSFIQLMHRPGEASRLVLPVVPE
jgi:putative CocE/NonD family hydrolase